MDTVQTIEHTRNGTHPFLMQILFITVIATVIYFGSHFSQQRSMARMLETAGIEPGVATSQQYSMARMIEAVMMEPGDTVSSARPGRIIHRQ